MGFKRSRVSKSDTKYFKDARNNSRPRKTFYVSADKKRDSKGERFHNSKNERNSQFLQCQQYKDKSDTEDSETQQYFQHVLDRLESGFDDEDEKNIFLKNVLQQTEGKELELSFKRISSYCIQMLLELCTDFHFIRKFMEPFSECPVDMFSHRHASHVTETLLRAGLRLIQISEHKTLPSDEVNEHDCEIFEFVSKWILLFGHSCLENIEDLLFHVNASHVIRTIVEVLGGYEIEEKISHSKKARSQKKKPYSSLGLDTKPQPSVLNVPKEFLKLLKKLCCKVLKSEQVTCYAMDPTVSPLLQTMLLVIKRQKPKLCKKLVNHLIMEIFAEKNKEKTIPAVLLHKNSSYFAEQLIVVAENEQLAYIWEEQIKPCLKQLIEHPVGGFIVQKLLYSVTDKLQYETIFDEMSHYFDDILNSHHHRIFVAIADACNRLSARQAQFIRVLMECLHCLEPEIRWPEFVPLTLMLATYECYQSKQESKDELSQPFSITLTGSLIVQQLLKFHKPIKIVNGLLALKPEKFTLLSCNLHGCHVLSAFLQSQSVGEKSKDKLIQCLKVAEIALDENGSTTLARIWKIASLKQKSLMAKELAHNEKTLNSNPWSRTLMKKFAISHYKNRQEEWKQIQNMSIKKRKMFDDIIEGIKRPNLLQGKE